MVTVYVPSEPRVIGQAAVRVSAAFCRPAGATIVGTVWESLGTLVSDLTDSAIGVDGWVLAYDEELLPYAKGRPIKHFGSQLNRPPSMASGSLRLTQASNWRDLAWPAPFHSSGFLAHTSLDALQVRKLVRSLKRTYGKDVMRHVYWKLAKGELDNGAVARFLAAFRTTVFVCGLRAPSVADPYFVVRENDVMDWLDRVSTLLSQRSEPYVVSNDPRLRGEAMYASTVVGEFLTMHGLLPPGVAGAITG